MGYCSLESVDSSDNASDFRYTLIKQKNVMDTVRLFKEELKNEANCYNTPGYVNIALVVEDGFIDRFDEKDKSKFKVVIKKTIARLETEIKILEHETEDNLVYHRKSFQRMHNNLTNWVKENHS